MNKWQFTDQSPVCKVCGSNDSQERFWCEIYIGTGQYIMHCGNCNFAYLFPFPTIHTIDVFYSDDYRKVYSFGSSSKYDEEFLKHCLVDEIGKLRAELIFRNFGYPKKLLEIGAGFGGFLKSVSELSGGTVSYALEADSKCFIRISQYSTLIDSFEEMKNDKIEMVCAFHVLEHVLDPKQFVAEIADLLVEGGLVVFEVPDLLSNWMDWDSHIHGAHQSYFTSHSLQLLLRDHGMKPELIEQYGVGEILNGSILVVARKETEIGPQTESPKLVCNQVANIRRKLHAKKPSYLARLKARFRRLVKYIFGSEFIGKRQRKKFYANNSVLLK